MQEENDGTNTEAKSSSNRDGRRKGYIEVKKELWDEKGYTAISRKFVKNKVHATIPKGNMGYDQYTVSNDCSCRTYFCYFPSALANIYQWPPVRFF